jgi:hypothetical protein
VPRPEDDDRSSASQSIGDSFVERLAGTDLAIPPHLPTERRERANDAFSRRTIFGRVAHENVRIDAHNRLPSEFQKRLHHAHNWCRTKRNRANATRGFPDEQ